MVYGLFAYGEGWSKVITKNIILLGILIVMLSLSLKAYISITCFYVHFSNQEIGWHDSDN